MKSVLLDEYGYTADGEWRLVKTKANTDMFLVGQLYDITSAASYEQMVLSSPAPVLAEAVPADVQAALATLNRLGYTFCGGQEWKPPLGETPDFNLLDKKNERIAELEASNRELQKGCGFGQICGPRIKDLERENANLKLELQNVKRT